MKSRTVFSCIFLAYCLAEAGILIYRIRSNKENNENIRTNNAEFNQEEQDKTLDELEQELRDRKDELNELQRRLLNPDPPKFVLPAVPTKVEEIKTLDDFLENEYLRKNSNKPFIDFIKISAKDDILYYKINKNRTVFIGELFRLLPEQKGNKENFKISMEEYIIKVFIESPKSECKNRFYNIKNGIIGYFDIDCFPPIIVILDELVEKMKNEEILFAKIHSIYIEYLRNILIRVSKLSDEELKAESSYCEIMEFNTDDAEIEVNKFTKNRLKSGLIY